MKKKKEKKKKVCKGQRNRTVKKKKKKKKKVSTGLELGPCTRKSKVLTRSHARRTLSLPSTVHNFRLQKLPSKFYPHDTHLLLAHE